MELCAMDDEQAAYRCMPCRVLLCMKHKDDHEMKKGSHIYEKLFIELTPEQNAIFVESLLANIKIAEEFKANIIKETIKRIEIIKKMCMKALEDVEKKILKMCEYLVVSQQRIFKIQANDIERQFNTVFEINMPSSSRFEEVEQSYELGSLQEKLQKRSNLIFSSTNQTISEFSGTNQKIYTQILVQKNPNGGIPSTNPTLGFSNEAPNGLPAPSNNRPGGAIISALPNQNVQLLPTPLGPSQAFGAHSGLPVPSSTQGPNLTGHPPAPLNRTGLPQTTNFNQGGNLMGPGGISHSKPAMPVNNLPTMLQGPSPNTVGMFPVTIPPPGFSKSENLPIPGNFYPSMPTSSVNKPPGQNLTTTNINLGLPVPRNRPPSGVYPRNDFNGNPNDSPQNKPPTNTPYTGNNLPPVDPRTIHNNPPPNANIPSGFPSNLPQPNLTGANITGRSNPPNILPPADKNSLTNNFNQGSPALINLQPGPLPRNDFTRNQVENPQNKPPSNSLPPENNFKPVGSQNNYSNQPINANLLANLGSNLPQYDPNANIV